MLTGRRDRLNTIRQYQGLAPFCSIFESEHDIMGAGHASTSIGYAVGLKEAMRKGIGEDGHVVAVIGDGALTGGVAYEALHNAGGLETPIVIVLNDTKLQQWPDGQPEVFRTEVADDIKFNQPVTHTVKTIGDKPLRNIVIELKP